MLQVIRQPGRQETVKEGTHWPNCWMSEAFGETWMRLGTNIFGVFSCVGSFGSHADVVCSDLTCKVWEGWLSAVSGIGFSDWRCASKSARCVGGAEYCVRFVFLCTLFHHFLFLCSATYLQHLTQGVYTLLWSRQHVDYATQSDNGNYPSIHAGEKIGLLGRSMSYPGTLGGAVPISTSGNRNTSSWPLYVASCLGIQERWRTKSETEHIHAGVMRLSNNLGALIQLWEIWSGQILVRLRCIHAF